MRRETAPEIDIRRLISAAFAVLKAVGLAELSMRRVAAELGVQAPAIYWHVESKAALLGLMARDIYASAYSAVPQTQDWRTWLVELGRALRASFANHRDGANLCATWTPTYSDPVAHAEKISAPLMARGLSQASALRFQSAVIAFVIGWGLIEANGPMQIFLNEMMVFEDGFEVGLEAIVSGLRL